MKTRLPLFAALSVIGFVLFVEFSSPPTSSAHWQSEKTPIMQNSQAIPNASVCPFSPQTPVDWDPRLGPGGLPRLENVRIIPVNVVPGQVYWRVVSVLFEDVNQSGNDHTIYVRIIDEQCNRLFGVPLTVYSDTSGEIFPDQPIEQPDGAACNCNYRYPMFGDGYDVRLPYPSDAVAGMIMPMRRHVNYRITYQRTTLVTVPSEVPEADTLLFMGSGLGGLALWVTWQRRKMHSTRSC